MKDREERFKKLKMPLDKFEDKKKSDKEILEEIERDVNTREITRAIKLLDGIKSPVNLFISIRLILNGIEEIAKESNEAGREELRVYLRELIPYINGIPSERLRASLLGDLARTFYLLNDEFNGDLALKVAINLASNYPDLLRDILISLVENNLIEKASYAFKLVRKKEVLDQIFVYLAEKLYQTGDEKTSIQVINNISDPFHRATAFYYLAMIEENKDRDKAIEFTKRAIEEAEKIKEPETRLELLLKLTDYLHTLRGEQLDVLEVLGESSPADVGDEEDNTYEEHES
jgi:hypothetical protein